MKKNIKTTWRKVKLGEVVEIIDGDRGVNYPGNGEFFRNSYCLFLNAKNVCGTGFDFSDTQFITKKKDDLLRSGKMQRGDFVLTTRGTIGNIAHYGKEIFYDHIRINSGMVILRTKKDIINEKFFYLFLISQEFENQIEALKSGSAQPQLPIRDLRFLEINIPSLDEQEKIVKNLYPISDKIELNNKINQNLEQMARAIFKEWFINFKFPGHKKVKMIDSELGKIPEGWEVVDAEKVFIFEKGVEPGSNSYSIAKKVNFVPFYRVKDLAGKNAYTDVFINKEVANNKICQYDDVLISFDGTVGRIKVGCSGAFSSGIRRVYPKDGFIRNSFIYFWLKTPYVQNTILEHSSGTTILHAGSSIDFLKISFNKETINRFQKIAEPIFSKILETEKENQKLASLRDLLLPKLMSGEIRV